MMALKQYLKIIYLVAGLFIAGNCFNCSFAEENVAQAYYSAPKREECIKNFNINNVDFNTPKAMANKMLLAEYFQCRAAVRDNVSECEKLRPCDQCVERCRDYFEAYQGFFGRLSNTGQLTSQIMASFTKYWGADAKTGEGLAKAWLAGDVSFCEQFGTNNKKYSQCKAIVSGNPSLCSDDACAHKAAYAKAVKSRNIKDCAAIKNSAVRAMCQGFINADEKTCEKNKGFEDFRNAYCE